MCKETVYVLCYIFAGAHIHSVVICGCKIVAGVQDTATTLHLCLRDLMQLLFVAVVAVCSLSAGSLLLQLMLFADVNVKG